MVSVTDSDQPWQPVETDADADDGADAGVPFDDGVWVVPDGVGEDIDEDVDAVTAAALAAIREEFGDLDEALEALRTESPALPVVAVVGRPNVGKSTLVNRILGRREAVVEDVPGVTRDRVVYEAQWSGRDFLVIDTGGWQSDAKGLAAQIAAQAERAISEADVVMFVVDATVGHLDEDDAVVRVLRRSGLPILLVANKVDDAATEAEVASLWSLGLGEPHAVSALHGRSSGDLLDSLIAKLPEVGRGSSREGGPRRVALLGRPNVGKSSLLNALAGESRVVVDSVAGTTVDPVDELVELKDRWWWFVDTAGIRRRVREASGHEYYASLRTKVALEKAEVAIVLVDAADPISEQDTRILSLVVESGRALVIAYNKWDLMDDDRRRYLEREIDRDLNQVAWAPRVNISARTGRHVEKLVVALDEALEGWGTRISTSQLNAFLSELAAAHPHPIRGGRQPRIMFGTQVAVQPPTFVLFTTGFLEAGYRRFIERRLREEYGFRGSPIRINLRIREKRRR